MACLGFINSEYLVITWVFRNVLSVRRNLSPSLTLGFLESTV